MYNTLRGKFIMEKSKVDLYLMTNAKYFEPTAIPMIKTKLENMSDDSFMMLQTIELKDPSILLVVSILLGTLGIDRFLIGDIGMGVLKLLTCGLCGILTIVDWFLIMKRTKEKNLEKILAIL